MCGILGLVAGMGSVPRVSEANVVAMRDAMAHRGPDGAGLLDLGQVVLAHRRLAVVDTSPNGSQPFVDPLGRGNLVYNGELYNDAELRAELGALGWQFRTRSDTETVLAVLIQWGAAGVSRLRGMYALGFCDGVRRSFVLARDPLGIKPLYWWLDSGAGGAQMAFASEVRALLRHPDISARPDFATIYGYVTTIRTTLGRRTLFDGVRTLMPGEVIEFDLTSPNLAAQRAETKWGCVGVQAGGACERVREALNDSVARHLRADVPTCSLLSGGLDSSVIAMLAARHDPSLSTFCAGARGGGSLAGDDFSFAAMVAAHLRTRHVEAPVDRSMFVARWSEMVERMGLPLSTPNEVAINEVARTLRAQGNVVALSGEGADELFGGYSLPMVTAWECVRDRVADPMVKVIEESSWVPPSARSAVMGEGSWVEDACEHLLEQYRGDFAQMEAGARASGSGDAMEPYLRMLRRVNLEGLLRRLDSAMMLEGVEGRTPFADRDVAALAESLPMDCKFKHAASGQHGTKVVLREAFEGALPAAVVSREKASFPLPFQEWVGDRVSVLRDSALAREVFSEAAIHAVTSQPAQAWRFAWPMVNIAMWGKVWWG